MPKRRVTAGIRAASTSLSGQTGVGLCLPFTGRETDCPSGWLLCAGQAVNRLDYPNLFRYYQLLGFPHGSGDGVNTFNIPDMRGRQIFGKDDMGGVAANRITSAGCGIVGTTVGASGGLENHTLTSVQAPSHNHGGITGSTHLSHTHTYDTYTSNAGREAGPNGHSIPVAWGGTTSAATMDHAHALGTTDGGGLNHNNMNSVVIFCWLVKV